MKYFDFVDHNVLTVRCDLTPDGWRYPGRSHPERAQEVERIIRDGLHARSITIGVSELSAVVLILQAETGGELARKVYIVRDALQALQEEWSASDFGDAA